MTKKGKSLKRILKKINVTTIFFFLLSAVSTTFAWFAYNNVIHNNMEIELKSWEVSIDENGNPVARDLDIRIDDFRPGMDLYSRDIVIQNHGDLAAVFDFEVESIRILNTTYPGSDNLLDELSQNYPFFFNFRYDTNYLETDTVATFSIVAGWPLDSGNDALDTEWGNLAYDFYEEEEEKLALDPTYEPRSAIELHVKLNVSQYAEEENIPVSDNNYRFGTYIASDNGYVAEIDNLQSSSTVDLVVYGTNTYTYNEYLTKNGTNTDTGKTVSLIDLDYLVMLGGYDIYNATINVQNTSPRIQGIIRNSNDYSGIINKLMIPGSYIQGIDYIGLPGNCFWIATEYDATKAFAVVKASGNVIRIEPINKSTKCTFAGIYTKIKE